jgi:UDP-N-acetylglucosamine--N-acetylmuramyl-(pentapeptide) pyrophosphoryl-undecaprenol N-acetylglucosamine transferase
MGGGGYVAGPVGLAAVLLRIPLVLTEADSHLGLANRLLAGRARRVCLAFPIAGRAAPRYRVTGRPVPPPCTDRAAARAGLGIDADATCVLVFGGSLGARSVNQAAIAGLAGAPYTVLHVSGRRDHDELASRAQALGERYVLRDYVTPFGLALAAADLAVARSGGSVFELAQYGLPAVLVPYPHASGDHQTGNARWMERAGAAVVIGDEELTPERLRAAVDAIAKDAPRRRAMAAAARGLARPDAAHEIAGEVLAAAALRSP